MDTRRPEFAVPDMKIGLDRCAEKGWTAPTWPVEDDTPAMAPFTSMVHVVEGFRIRGDSC